MQASQHPLMVQIQKDVAEANAKAEQERLLADMEAARVRQEQGQYLNKQFQAAIAEYEEGRKVLHKQVGKIWEAAQAYSRVTGVNPPGFMENQFNEVNIPTLIPDESPWGQQTSFTTTRAAVMAWFSCGGKAWT